MLSMTQEGLPEYLTNSLGKPDLRNIANRVRDLAALLASQDCPAEAEHLGYVQELLRARMSREIGYARVAENTIDFPKEAA